MTPHLQFALNNAWANATLYTALREMPVAAFSAPYPSFFGSIPATLDHILAVDEYYIDALTAGGRGRAVFDRAELRDVDTLTAAQAERDMALASFCRDLSPEDLDRRCAIERRHGMTHELVGAALLHLFQHQIHHRGQVHGMMSQAGIAPPQLDDFFLEDGRADSAKAYWGG